MLVRYSDGQRAARLVVPPAVRRDAPLGVLWAVLWDAQTNRAIDNFKKGGVSPPFFVLAKP